MGNVKYNIMESLALKGNGSYAYIDDQQEATRAFGEGISKSLYTVARDTKAQVSFNSASILQYRLLGYENKQMSQDDYDDETKDAGEIGTGLCVTAVYELVMSPAVSTTLCATVEIKYKNPDINDNTEYIVQKDVLERTDLNGHNDLKFITAIIETCLIMSKSIYKGNANLDSVIARLESISNLVNDPLKYEFLSLVKMYQQKYHSQ